VRFFNFFRIYILSRLHHLEHLDSSPTSSDEKKHASIITESSGTTPTSTTIHGMRNTPAISIGNSASNPASAHSAISTPVQMFVSSSSSTPTQQHTNYQPVSMPSPAPLQGFKSEFPDGNSHYNPTTPISDFTFMDGGDPTAFTGDHLLNFDYDFEPEDTSEGSSSQSFSNSGPADNGTDAGSLPGLGTSIGATHTVPTPQPTRTQDTSNPNARNNYGFLHHFKWF
jgi:hypothetical protein